MSDGLGWLTDRQRDGGVDRIPLPRRIDGDLWLCGKHAIAHRYASGAWDTVVSLVERHEIEDQYPDYTAWLDRREVEVIWHPIHDLHAPPLDTMSELVGRVGERLQAGDRVVMHCAAGKGRAGTTAVCVLVASGVPLDDALRTVATARPGAGPEAGVQRDVVVAFAASSLPGSS